MTIEQEAERDQALDADQAENIVGGKKAVKATRKATKYPATKTYPVDFINLPATTGGPIDDSGASAWSEACDNESMPDASS